MKIPSSKVTASLIVISIACSLGACGQSDKNKNSSNTAENSQANKPDSGDSATSSNTSAPAGTATPTVPVVTVRKLQLQHKIDLPGELRAYQDVPIHAKVEGFISWIGVDRGSILQKGDRMMTIYCPELVERTREAEAKESSAVSAWRRAQANIETQEAALVEVQAKAEADNLTYQRLQEASKTPGAIAQNEVDIQGKTVESDRARVKAVEHEIKAAKAVAAAEQANVRASHNIVLAEKAMNAYLIIQAPFNGVVTERNVHTGSIVSVDPTRGGLPLVRFQERDLLRLVVAVPEACVAGLKDGQNIPFTVPAYLGRTFTGQVARLGYALDQSTRTMPVELNVWNTNDDLEPGMFATVHWMVTRPYQTLFVPSSAVTADLKNTFVNLVQGDTVKRVKVQRGQSMGNLIEIVGNIKEGDKVTLKATDDLKTGTRLIAKAATKDDINAASKESSAGGD